ncbi:MAG: uracil-DNA glycosylase [Gammaproteobacteria bacterium]
MASLTQLQSEIVACEKCPRLRTHSQSVARARRASYRDFEYWGRPVPGFGSPSARIWIVGLAPGAHGANRTGRMFTGDRSGDFLFAALHRAGLCNQPVSATRDDGLQLRGCYISAAARCAPPGNHPTLQELSNCRGFLEAELRLLRRARVILALGSIAWDAVLRAVEAAGRPIPRPRPMFSHGALLPIAPGLTLVGSYHVSQQNTFTGRLTEAMFDQILRQCRTLSRSLSHRATGSQVRRKSAR